MGLIISRRIGDELVLFANPDADPDELAQCLADGITIRVHDIDKGKAYLAVEAPKAIDILRGELAPYAEA